MQMVIGNSGIKHMSMEKLDQSMESLNMQEENLDENEISRYKKGDYKIILQLISVLQYGKISKKLTDKAIDLCEQLQNLRVAVYDYKLRTEACEPGSAKYETLLSIGLNYLVRYFYLITFADYLLQTMTSLSPQSLTKSEYPSFSHWLKERQEILNLVDTCNQSLN